MANRSLTPFREGRLDPFPSPFFGRDLMSRFFDDFVPARGFGFDPEIDVRETDKEIEISVELPGVDQKDVEVTVEDDMLTIRGEKRSERNEERGNYRYAERSFGSFQRALRLPLRIDPAKVKARFDKGVLEVRLPKDGEAVRGRRIQIASDDTSGIAET